jgi:hypothetical protein
MTSSVCAMSAFGSSKLVSEPPLLPRHPFRQRLLRLPHVLSPEEWRPRRDHRSRRQRAPNPLPRPPSHPAHSLSSCPGADLSTPLNAFRSSAHTPWSYVTAAQVTALLRAAASAAPHLGLLPSQLTARSTRSGGAMALLCGGVDADRIRLLGRWRSDAIFRYLHTQAPPSWPASPPPCSRGGHFHLTPSSSSHPHATPALPSAVAPPILPLWVHQGDPDPLDPETPSRSPGGT